MAILAAGMMACGSDDADAGSDGNDAGSDAASSEGDACIEAIVTEVKAQQELSSSMESLIRGMVMIRGLDICEQMLACLKMGTQNDCLRPVGTCINDEGPERVECSWTGPTSTASTTPPRS